MTVDTLSNVSHLLASLGLEADNPGAFAGTWIPTHGERVVSLNPATGEQIKIPAKTVVKIAPAKALKDAFNKKAKK